MNEKEQFKLKLGEYIAEIRKERKMTQEELAEKVGRTAIAISNIENGKVIPELLTVFELANALQVNGYVFMHRLWSEYEYYKESVQNERSYGFNKGEQIDDEEIISKTIDEKHIKQMFYPEKWGDFKKYKITTLFEFLIYLPLFDECTLWDSLYRIAGACVNYEDYICNQMEHLIHTIPDSRAKQYALRKIDRLSHEENPEDWNNPEVELEAKAYLDVIKRKIEHMNVEWQFVQSRRESL